MGIVYANVFPVPVYAASKALLLYNKCGKASY
jgi:hypothetical protein